MVRAALCPHDGKHGYAHKFKSGNCYRNLYGKVLKLGVTGVGVDGLLC